MNSKPDTYKDSDYRYLHDAAFHAAVDMMEHFATTEGYTPGELRQIAFYAALRVEMKRPPELSDKPRTNRPR